MQSTSSTTVFSNVHTDMTDPEGPVARPQHGSDSGKEAYSCLCGSFILVLCTVLVIFVVGIVKARLVEFYIHVYLLHCCDEGFSC